MQNYLFCNNKSDLLIFLGPALTGIAIFVILSHLLVPTRINIPISVSMSFLILWLTKYYVPFNNKVNDNLTDLNLKQNGSNETQVASSKSFFRFLFIILYAIFLLITFFTQYDSNIFVSWTEFTAMDVIKLTSAIGLSFFMPGYAIVSLICDNSKLQESLKFFLGYLISILISGLCAYITAALGFAVLDNKNFVMLTYATILGLYTAAYYKNIFQRILLTSFSINKIFKDKTIILKRNISILSVFLALLAIEVIFTYYLFNGTIIGDQWFHHGRSLLFINGAFKDVYTSAPDYYPPLLSSILSEFFVLSGVPSVNAYVSLNFLNIVVALVFYLFVRKWLPDRVKKAALLATVLFMLSSGFGWTYVLQLSTSGSLNSQNAVLEIFRIASLKTVDLNAPNNFLNTPHPWVLSNLIIISLPAGFMLLSLLKVNLDSKLKYFTLILLVCTVGITSHDEFYLFILISSVLPLIYQVTKAHIIFVAMLSSITLVLLIDILLPVKYYTLSSISGIPLPGLCFAFVLIMWALYSSRLPFTLGKRRPSALKNAFANRKRIKFVVVTAVVSIVIYSYFLSFLVWTNLSVEQVSLQTDNYGQRDIPWYIMPMKFGLIGILGILYILSYLYKKFERQIFIFGIITVFAFLFGPYYDEHRFGKYIMLGLIGFASLLIYSIIFYFQNLGQKALITGIFLGLIVTSSGLSLLMLAGFSDLLLMNPDYRLIPGENNRFFPTKSEMDFFTVLKNKIVDLKTDNVALLNKDYGDGFLSEKLMAFVGIPSEMIYHNPLILNASSLPAFFDLVESNEISYIIIEKEDLKSTLKYTDPTRFAIDNFQKVYQDNYFVVLRVPQLLGPVENPKLALIYDPIDYFRSPSFDFNLKNEKKLDWNDNSGNVQINKNGGVVLLNNESSPSTVWAKLDNKKINFIETDLKINRQNIPGKNAQISWANDTSLFQQEVSSQYQNNNVGIKWEDKGLEYSLLLTKAGLELVRNNINGSDETYVLRNQEVSKDVGEWYNLKVFMLKKEIIIFVNDRPRIQFPIGLDKEEDTNIVRIGLTSNGNNVEFGPLKRAQISNLDGLYYNNSRKLDHILASLAMSNASYGVYSKADLSSVSRNVIFPIDPTSMSNGDFNKYVESAKMGSTIIVFNSENANDGMFSRLLSINYTNVTSEFSKISNGLNDISLSGIANILNITTGSDLEVVSYYKDKFDKQVTPFAIVKSLANGGKIVYVNGEGLFDSISKRKGDFLKLRYIANSLGIDHNNSESRASIEQINSKHQFSKTENFIGLAELYGKVKINGSSLIAYNDIARLENITLPVDNIVLSSKMKRLTFDNVTIKTLKLYGQFTAELDSHGYMRVPSSNSYYDYIDFHMPTESSIKIKVSPQKYGGAEISIINKSKVNTFNFTDDFEIDIHQDRHNSAYPLNFLIKNPEIKLNGSEIIDSPDFINVLLSGNRFLKINGEISYEFDHVDNHYEKNDNIIDVRPITYLKNVNIAGETNPQTEKWRIMGDISYRAKNHNLDIPLQEIFGSTENFIIIISVLVICFFASRLIQSSKFISKL